MRINIQILCFLLLSVASTAHSGDSRLLAKGATEDGIFHDCRVTAELSVKLLQMRGKTAPDQLKQAASKILTAGKYKGSFGDTEFIAVFYTGLALQMDESIDDFMLEARPVDIEDMIIEHEAVCLQNALSGPPPK